MTELVVNGDLINGGTDRFSLNSGNYDLTLLSAKWTDSGIYTCAEDTGFNTRHVTHLIVTGMNKTSFSKLSLILLAASIQSIERKRVSACFFRLDHLSVCVCVCLSGGLWQNG